MSSLKAMAFSGVLVALAAAPCLGGEARGEYDYGEDMLSVKERAALELKRRREAQPVLACEPESLSAKARQGKKVTLRLSVLNKGGRTLRWSVTSAPVWLTLDRKSGDLGFEEKQILVIGAKRSTAGTVRGRIIFEAPGAGNSPLTVPVVLNVELVKRPVPPRGRPLKPERPRRPSPSRPKRRRFGVRAGYSKLSEGDRGDLDGSALFGLRFELGGGPKLSWELGLDVAGTDAANGNYSSTLYAGRLDALFGLGKGKRLYLLAGLHELVEDGEELGASYTNYVTAVNLGGGFRFGDARYDVRVTYSVVIGSENSTGLVVASAGVAF